VISRLNLASDPFRNRTLPWTVAAVVSLASLVALVYTLSNYRTASAEAAAADRQVAVMRDQRKEFERQAVEIRQTIPPEQRQTLDAAHTLVSRKGFSWSQLFSDLEGSLPQSVRVSRINVREVSQVGDQTRADLDLTVVGRTPSDVTGMITEMSRLGTFSAVPVTENQKSGRGESGYEWLLRVSYVQRSRRAGRPASGDAGASARARGAGGDNSEAGGRD
jgi:Tfp pilus assembly protein PilN